MMINSLRNQSRGFTIIELLVASTVFSVILMICMSGVVRMGQIFYKGTNTARTQDAARGIMDEISQAVQFNKDAITPTNGSKACIGPNRYTYVLNRQLDDNPGADPNKISHVLQRDIDGGSCPNPPATSAATELLTPGMRLTRFDILPLDGSTPGGPKLWRINVWVVYGDEDLLTDPLPNGHRQCKGGAGSEYCAVSELSATVYRRVQ